MGRRHLLFNNSEDFKRQVVLYYYWQVDSAYL